MMRAFSCTLTRALFSRSWRAMKYVVLIVRTNRRSSRRLNLSAIFISTRPARRVARAPSMLGRDARQFQGLLGWVQDGSPLRMRGHLRIERLEERRVLQPRPESP